MLNEYEGIVIKSINYKDNDKIIHIFTKEIGKVSCIARGVRKIKKKSETNVELFNYSHYNLYKGRGFYHVNQSHRIDSFFELREDIEKLSFASLILEITDSGLEEEEENSLAFELLIKTLKTLASTETDKKKLLLSYQLKFISFIGYKPELKRCINCGEMRVELHKSFNISEGGVLCANCKGINTYNSLKDINSTTLRILKELLYSKLEDLGSIEIPLSEEKRVTDLVFEYLYNHMGKRNFKSLELLKTLNLI